MKGDTVLDEDVMLSTSDNPWSPFTHFDEWRQFDEAAGHYTLALLGRVVVDSSELSEADQEIEILDAINEIVDENVSGVHIKVFKDQNINSGD